MEYKENNHFAHMFITLLFFPWFIVWCAYTVHVNAHNKKVDEWLNEKRIKEDREMQWRMIEAIERQNKEKRN